MDVRQSILETATRLFAAHGFDGTSLQDIAESVGIRKASLLYHFPAKEKLRLAVLDRLLDTSPRTQARSVQCLEFVLKSADALQNALRL